MTAAGVRHRRLVHPADGAQRLVAAEWPQPETLFRPDAAQLAVQGCAGGGGGEWEGEGSRELPFVDLPTPSYAPGEEVLQPMSPPEPENPLPPELPPNHPAEASVVALVLWLVLSGGAARMPH